MIDREMNPDFLNSFLDYSILQYLTNHLTV